jgi:hypothetical protein
VSILTHAEQQRIIGRFSPEFLERLRNRFLVEQIEAAVADGKIPESAVASHRMPAIGGGAAGFFASNAECISMLTDHFVGINAGTAAVIQIYSGSVPADADAANAGTLLATLTCSATAQTSIADDTPGALATFASITGDSSADDDGTAAFFRISTQSGGTVTDQGTVGTSDADLILNTVAITSGSTVDITAATLLLPEGP